MSALSGPLPDQHERDRFCRELETNFSVIAPAGVGKTTSIVARVLAIAEADARRPGSPVLPRLVVVTYTRKAADEMFSRVRLALDEARPHGEVHAHLAQAFFGTIHSFCQRLLAVAGPLCGLPGEVQIETDEERLWREFRLEQSDAVPALGADLRRAFALHGRWEDVFALARQWPADLATDRALPGLPPKVDGAAIAAVELKGAAKTRENLAASQERFREWALEVGRQAGLDEPMPCPEPKPVGSAKAMVAAWQETFAPLRRWRAEVTSAFAARVAEDFARFRRRTGRLTFDDLIHSARRLLEHPQARAVVRERGWRVILDEAQDTDPTQFVVLTELARPVEAPGVWLDGAAPGPRPGHFTMVGDPQQSIYSDRADLARYLQVHDRLLAEGGQRLTFSVTMRCPVQVVDCLNTTFPAVLGTRDAISRQVDFVPLDNPDGARRGQVVRLPLPEPPAELEGGAEARMRAYAQVLVQWLAARTPEDFGTTTWDQVAILCPRSRWLDAIGSALQAAGLPMRQISRRATRAGDPVHAWYAALLTVFAHPRDHFELYGVLRDVFGFSDDALARFIARHYERGEVHPLRLDQMPPEPETPVGCALAFLFGLLERVRRLPLYEAVEMILAQCRLRDRLQAVPALAAGTIDPTLDRLRQETAAAESNQEDLAAWARRQRLALAETLESEPSSEASITLLTAHKSKGLGFDVVILPCFFRRFSNPSDRYPCFERSPSGPPRVLFDGNDRDPGASERTERRRVELHERLLYVSLTRVKRTLVLVDDAPWWQGLPRQQGESWAGLMRVEDEEAVNRGAWLRLSPALGPSPDELPPAPTAEPAPAAVEIRLSGEFRQGEGSWRRVTPSSLQVHEAPPARVEPDLRPDERFSEEARALYLRDPAAYGNWWHETMEHAPWAGPRAAFEAFCREAAEGSPDPARAQHEIAQFLASAVVSRFVDTGWIVRTEVPFLLGDVSSKTGYEGYIDFLAVRDSGDAWYVVDWKTDRLPGPDPAAQLRTAYAPQLAVYGEAVSALLGANGRCGLFSTVSGALVELPTA